ncbi:YpiF family protein [Litchfieldia salsa]|uniref:DUF2487 family protein n=1 Tax=Litchfieldia salsa TaxID=930152 RepID=A0A1H0TLA4_9BACI|nr:YpiF family protein [Litchfieldia salsa]SDP54807.1 Protein of unknown function [Litchfieldia salsa]
MKWTTKDIDLYLKSKEYVDTAIVPLLPVTFDNNLKKTVEIGEFTTVLSQEIERQFKGRVVLFPSFTYSETEGIESSLSRLSSWSDESLTSGFKHLIFITSDTTWKQHEESLKGSLISIPTLPLEHLDDRLKQSMLQDQMKGLITIFMRIWQD